MTEPDPLAEFWNDRTLEDDDEDATPAAQGRATLPADLLALYDEILGPQNGDDLDEYLAEKRDDPEFVVAYIRAHITALRTLAAGTADPATEEGP